MFNKLVEIRSGPICRVIEGRLYIHVHVATGQIILNHRKISLWYKTGTLNDGVTLNRCAEFYLVGNFYQKPKLVFVSLQRLYGGTLRPLPMLNSREKLCSFSSELRTGKGAGREEERSGEAK